MNIIPIRAPLPSQNILTSVAKEGEDKFTTEGKSDAHTGTEAELV